MLQLYVLSGRQRKFEYRFLVCSCGETVTKVRLIRENITLVLKRSHQPQPIKNTYGA